jgi:hypothetical protein
MTVTRNILSPGISGEINSAGGSFEVVEQIPWADTIPRLREIFPLSTSSAIGLPEIDPFFGIYRASSVKMRAQGQEPKQIGKNIGFSAGVKIPVYDHNIFTITYSSIENSYSDGEDRSNDPVPFLSHSWSAGGEVITMENADMTWTGGDKARAHAAASNANFIVPTIEHSITWHRVMSPPFAAIRTAMGKVNENTMDLDTGVNIWPETLLFLGAELSRDFLTDGSRVWQVVYKFSERRVETGRKSSRVGLSPASKNSDGVGLYISGGQRYSPSPGVGSTDEDSNLPLVTSTIGGWNHFFRQNSGATSSTYAPGFYRLHLTGSFNMPARNTNYFQDSFAVFKKANLELLFTQV